MNMHLRERPSHVRTFEMIETQALRRRMEAAIETMIAALDELDGEPDLELEVEHDEDGHMAVTERTRRQVENTDRACTPNSHGAIAS